MAVPRPDRIEGYAIVSADGMLADATGVMPPELKIEADQRFFYGALERVDAVVHGRNSHEGGPKAASRTRLIVTRQVPGIAPDPGHPKSVLWNPAGATFEQAWDTLGLPGGVLAVIGGTQIFGMFLDIGYDAFHLSRASRVRLPGGRPVFSQVPASTPEEVLRRYGLSPGPVRVLDAEKDVTLVTWKRQ